MTKTILVAPNAFKGSLNSVEAATVISKALKKYLKVKTILAPVADGGDGTLEIFKSHSKKSRYVYLVASNAQHKKIKTKWLRLNKTTAVIELAKISGISRLSGKKLAPMKSSSYGLGEVIKSALDKGCKNLIICLGGSATVDAGIGALIALGVNFVDGERRSLKPSANALLRVKDIDCGEIDKRLLKAKITVLCDVKSSVLGKNGVSKYFAQKGVTKRQEKILSKGFRNYCKVVGSKNTKNVHLLPMTGAAGAISYSFKAILGASLEDGFSYISKFIDLEKKVKKADVVITGEGKLDSQTNLGKGCSGVLNLARKHKKKTIAICGNYERNINWYFDLMLALKNQKFTIKESIKNPKASLEYSISLNLQRLRSLVL